MKKVWTLVIIGAIALAAGIIYGCGNGNGRILGNVNISGSGH